MISSIEPAAVLASAISAVGVTILYHYIGRDYLGADENEYWNRFRRALLGGFDQYVRDNSAFALTNRAKATEYFATVDMASYEVAVLFEEAGYVQGVLAGLKTRERDGETEYEAGSMVYRESRSDLLPDALAVYQTHVFWFENDDGTCDLYAHHEYSSANPVVAWPHYRAVGQDAERGKKAARRVVE